MMTPTSRASWKRSLRSAFTDKLPLKAAAIFFAFVLWLVVSAEEPTEEVVPVRFSPALDSGVVMEGEAPSVRALVMGRGRELLKLYTAPPVIYRRIRSGLRDSVRVEIGPADVDLPAGVTASVRDVRPRVVTFRLRRTTPIAPTDTASDIIRTPVLVDSAILRDTTPREAARPESAAVDRAPRVARDSSARRAP